MLAGTKSIKLISLFVVAFLCLNAGGVLCVAYCGQARNAAAAHTRTMLGSEHCRMHAEPQAIKDDKRTSIARAVDCCTLPVSFFAAPVEKSAVVDGPAAVLSAAIDFERVSTQYLAIRSEALPVYHPPPIDRRTDRILNCVIRI